MLAKRIADHMSVIWRGRSWWPRFVAGHSIAGFAPYHVVVGLALLIAMAARW